MKKWEIREDCQDYDEEYQFFDYDIVNEWWKESHVYASCHFQWDKNDNNYHFNENIDQ